jgi:hypothetical protein
MIRVAPLILILLGCVQATLPPRFVERPSNIPAGLGTEIVVQEVDPDYDGYLRQTVNGVVVERWRVVQVKAWKPATKATTKPAVDIHE